MHIQDGTDSQKRMVRFFLTTHPICHSIRNRSWPRTRTVVNFQQPIFLDSS